MLQNWRRTATSVDCPIILKEYSSAIRLLIAYSQFCNVRNVDSAELRCLITQYNEFVFLSERPFNRYLNTDYLAFCSIEFSLFCCLPPPWTLLSNGLSMKIVQSHIYLGTCRLWIIRYNIEMNWNIALVDFFWILKYWTNGDVWLCSKTCLL